MASQSPLQVWLKRSLLRTKSCRWIRHSADHLAGPQRLLPREDAVVVRTNGVSYIVGLAKNERLNALSAKLQNAPSASTAEAAAKCASATFGVS
jgi:hypothetical protein